MNDNLTIRRATVKDLPAVLKLFSQEDMDNGDVLTVEQAAKIYQKFSQYPDYNLYVVKICSAIVGTFALLVMDNLAHLGKPSAVIEDVVVDSDYRSQGIGKSMIEYAMRICKDRGCYKLSLSSNIKRKRAHAFYKTLGFKKHGYSFLIELH